MAEGRQRRRLLTQALFAALSNGYLKGFTKGRIYQGNLKYLCVPGLNCYSCPGALGSCPIGSLQATLTSGEYKLALYVIGFLTVFGTLFGRFVCGFLCPFGLLQDLLHRIPFPRKWKKLPGEKVLRFLRYLILLLFVILLPMVVVDFLGYGDPWFCKYICPTGTLEGGIPLVLRNSAIRSSIGFLYTWKMLLLGLTALGSIVLYRPFCRYICPLGAIYGLFNKVAIYRYDMDEGKCIHCGKCASVCEFGIDPVKTPNSIDCIRCGKCLDACPTNAITTLLKRKTTTDVSLRQGKST